MSKVITELSRLERVRRRQNDAASEKASASPAQTRSDSHPLISRFADRPLTYTLAIIAIVCIVTVVLSIQTLSQTRRMRESVGSLNEDLSKQGQRIAALEKSFQAAARQQADYVQTSRQDADLLSQQIQDNAQEASQAEIEMNLLRADLEAVKQMNQDLTEKVIDLSEELKTLTTK